MRNLGLLLLLPGIYTAQIQTDVEAINNTRGSVFDVKNTNIKSYSGIDGTPYLTEEFSPVKIDGYNGVLPNLRYNTYEDEMEYNNNGSLNYISKTDDLRISFKNLNKVYVLKNYNLDGQQTNGYLVELVNGQSKFGLYKIEKSEIVEYNNNTTNTYLKQKNPYFEKSKDVLAISHNSKFMKFPKNRKEFNLWMEKTESVDKQKTEEYLKKNKVNFTKEEDVVKLINFLNL